jgi:hypothetical protein
MSGITANKRSHQIEIQARTTKITTCFKVSEHNFYFTHYKSHRARRFLDVYYVFNAKLKALNDKRLKIIADYLSNIDKMTDAKAGELAKRTMEFRKQRIALDEKYYTAVAKATSKTIAARAMQVENFLQGAGDVAIGSKLPLIPK